MVIKAPQAGMVLGLAVHTIGAVVPPGGKLSVKSGSRSMTLSFKELDDYVGARASRGGLLPRGWQKVDGLVVE
jgi:topoisomerase-4 subunit A